MATPNTITEIIFSEWVSLNTTEKATCNKLFFFTGTTSLLVGTAPVACRLPVAPNGISYQLQAETDFRTRTSQHGAGMAQSV